MRGKAARDPWPRQRAGLLALGRDHRRIVGETGHFVAERLGTSLLVWLLVGIALALPAGLFLLQQRIVRWHIPLSLLVMLVLVSWIGTGLDTKLTGLLNGPLLTPFTGLTMLAAFFIATDFGSAAITPRGRLVYGALIGALLATTPPGATALAVTMVIANFCAPLIDQLCRPRIYGHAATIVNEEAR